MSKTIKAILQEKAIEIEGAIAELLEDDETEIEITMRLSFWDDPKIEAHRVIESKMPIDLDKLDGGEN